MTRILVVDDQRDVRTMICMVLRVKHFEVVEAGSAMREKVLELPVVAISGMTSFDAASHSVELSSLVCLRKPFRPNDLIGASKRRRAPARSPMTAQALPREPSELAKQKRPGEAGRLSSSNSGYRDPSISGTLDVRTP